MPSQLTLGVILALLLTVAGLGWYAKHQTERAAQAEQAAQLATETGDAWRLALEQQTAHAAATDRLLTESRRAQQALRATTDRRIAAYEHALRADPGAADWDSAAVPAAVAGRMCQYRADHDASAGTVPETAGAAAGADPDPACRPSNGDLWRWAERLVEAVERGNADKSALRAWAASGRAAPPAPPQ